MFMYDNDIRIIADLNPTTGNIQSRYVYVSQSHSPDYMIRGVDTYQFVKDHLGSIKLVVKVSDGSVAQEITYDEFGRVLSDTNPGFQPFGFAGGVYDAQTSLTKFGVRDYDAEVGRWLTKDPILFAGGDGNLYGYGFNDPINFVDPDGEYAIPLFLTVPALGPIALGAAIGVVGYMAYDWWMNPSDSSVDPLQQCTMNQNINDSGLRDKSDSEIGKGARDKSLSPQDRRKYQREEKARGLRNKQKRGNK